MTSKKELQITAPELTPVSLIAPQWKELKKRARTLNITTFELEACQTIDQFHKLAKRKYREQLRTAHPDHINGANGKRAKYGSRLNRIIDAYKWIISIKPELFERVAKNRTTVHDGELPLDWGMGWTEYDSRYVGFTILPRL